MAQGMLGMNAHREAWPTPTQSGTMQDPSLSRVKASVSANPPAGTATRGTALQAPRVLEAEGRSHLKTHVLAAGRIMQGSQTWK